MHQQYTLPVNEPNSDPKALGHVCKGEGAIRLEQLCVRLDTQLSDVVASVGGKETVTFELILCPNCRKTIQSRLIDIIICISEAVQWRDSLLRLLKKSS